MFIDWIGTDNVSERVTNQIMASEHAVEHDIPLIIFDRGMNLTSKEIEFFTGKRVMLLEPSVGCRKGFTFIPPWVDVSDVSLFRYKTKRKYELGITSLMDGDLVDQLYTTDIIIGSDCEYHEMTSTLVTYTKDDSKRGMIPSLAPYLNNDIVPMINHTDDWLHSLFDETLIVHSYADIEWVVSTIRSISGYPFVHDMKKNIKENHPEMIMENFVSQILGMLKEL